MPSEGETAISIDDASAFFLRDPLLAGLLRITGMSVWRAGVLGFAVFAVFMLGGGALISLIHGPDAGFLSLLDPREFYWVAFIYLVLAPLVCAFYAAEPVNIFHLFRGLWDNGVIAKENMTFQKVKDFLTTEIRARQRGAWLFVAIIIVTQAAALIWFRGELAQNDPFRFGAVRFWWTCYPIYFWVIWLPLNFSITYMLLWIVLRRTLAWLVMNKALRSLDVRPRLRYPDEVNGMAPIGDYFLRFAPLVALTGIWAAVNIGYPALFGQRMNVKLDSVLFASAYLAAIPIALIAPIWSTHVAMREAKMKMLRRLADELQNLLPSDSRLASQSEGRQWIENLDTLDKQYQLAERAYRTWPFRTPKFLGALLFAAGPLLSAGISFLAQKTIPLLLQKVVL